MTIIDDLETAIAEARCFAREHITVRCQAKSQPRDYNHVRVHVTGSRVGAYGCVITDEGRGIYLVRMTMGAARKAAGGR